MKYNGKSVEIMAMSECPNNCTHCFIRYKGHISFENLDRMMKDYTSIYDKVILNGTELLMNDKYIELCKKYGQDYIYTNGKLLTPEKRKLLKENGITRISISLHYGIQEQISKSSLKDISQTIIDTVIDGFDVRVLCTISKDNYKLLPEIAKYVHSLGATSLKFINLVKEGRAEDFGDVFLNTQDIEEFFTLLETTRNQYDKNDFFITRNGAFGDDEKRKNNFMCSAGKDSIIITSDNKVYPCNGLLHDEYCIGYWDETGIYIEKEIDHSPKKCLALERQLKR